MIKLNIKLITNLGILGAVLTGLLFPDTFNFKKIIPFFLALLLYFSFIKLDFKIKHFVRKEIFYYPLIIYLIAPLLVFILFRNINQDLLIGLILITITPTAIGSPVIIAMVKGDRELNIIHVLLANIVSPLSYSILLLLFFSKDNVQIPIYSIIIKIIFIIILPIILALAFKRINWLSKNSIKIGKYFSPFAFITIICVAVSSSAGKLYAIPGSQALLILIMTGSIALLLYSTGFLLSKDPKIRKTLALCMGHKNTALCVWIAIANFSSLTVLPAIVYIIFHHSINAFLIWKFHK